MATETLRPNAAGDECNMTHQVGCSACPNHYDCVDEAAADDVTTFIQNLSATKRDLYNLPASSGLGTINFIKIYFRVYRSNRAPDATVAPALKSDSIVTVGTAIVPTADVWETLSQQWNTNPADGGAWEWADIDALQIGVQMYNPGNYALNCTQVYVEVDYTPAPPVTIGKTAHMADKLMATGAI